MKSPEVSIIVPACNAGRTITAAIESAFAQTYREFEIIIVDDGSSDDTAKRVAEWGNQVVYVYQANGGAGSARNVGLARARGRLVAFLDADDVWMPRKLQRQVAYFEQFPSTGLLYSHVLVSPTPTTTLREIVDSVPIDASTNPPANIFCELLHGTVNIATVTVIAPRDVLNHAGGFDSLREMHLAERELWLRIAARHAIGYIPLPLAVRRRSASIGGVPEKMLAARSVWREATRLRPTATRGYDWRAVSLLGRRLLEPVLRMRRQLNTRAAWREQTANRQSSDLLHGTSYRRARRAVVQRIHAVDDIVSRIGNSRQRVLFEAASPLSLAVFRPVREQLERDERIQLWFTTSDESWDADRIFRAAGIVERVVTPAAARWMKFDAYVNTDFWNTTWLPRRARRIHMFHGVAGKYDLDAPTYIAPVVASFDRLLFPNRDRLLRYARAGLIDPDGPQAALIGYPKVDCLVDGSLDRATLQRSLGFDPATPTVVYAPTWSPYSSLHSIGTDVIRALSRLGVQVVLKLHDRSCDPDRRGSGGVDWSARMREICRDCRVHLARGADVSPYLVVADALITDHSSVGFEFMLLDRPVIVLDCPSLLEKARVAPDKVALLRSAAEVVGAGDDVGGAVVGELTRPERLSSRRRAIAEELFHGAGGATARAVQCIYDLLELPAPQSRSATERSSLTPELIGLTSALPSYESRATYRVS
jgi:glycosyltransferase involved in cell wall biosynthesis